MKYQSGKIGLQIFKKYNKKIGRQLEFLSEKLTEIESQQKIMILFLTKQKMLFDSLLKWDTTSKLNKELLHTLIKKLIFF